MEQPHLMPDQKQLQTLLDACRGGDRDAFHLLFEQYKDRVFTVAFHTCGNEAMAKDVTQLVFIKLFTSIDQYRNEAEFSTWLHRIVVNTCTDEIRKHRRFFPFGDKPPVIEAPHSDQDDRLQSQQLRTAVHRAVSSLKPDIRLPIILKYVEGLSYQEIADVLGCSAGTIASRLNRGHQLLAEKLAHLRDAIAFKPKSKGRGGAHRG